ncbi:MAG: hypothetical protein HY094_09955 [Candidatus Melainabacteria bacterium]|nr:hypothetical protein [Candidatus Melainabacteria bacterium]
MNKNKLLFIVFAILLTNTSFITEVVACNGFKAGPGYTLAKSYHVKVIQSGVQDTGIGTLGSAIFDYKMKVTNRVPGALVPCCPRKDQFAASIEELSTSAVKENIVITQTAYQLSFDIPLSLKLNVQPQSRQEIVHFMCNTTLGAGCSINGDCTLSFYIPETNQQINMPATVLAKPRK